MVAVEDPVVLVLGVSEVVAGAVEEANLPPRLDLGG